MKLRPAKRLAIALTALAVVAGGCSGSDAEPGSTLTVFGTWRGEEADAFRQVLGRFEAESGIEVRYTGSSSFITALRERVEEGDVPDVALFPQPGFLQDLAEEGYVRPLRPDVAELASENLLPSVAALGSTGRGLRGVPFRLNVKSLVWYRPEVFADRGYEVPSSWDELSILSTRIAGAGASPWCLGVAAFDATGWPATDWVEDIVLRQSGTEIYDAWVSGELPFTDDAIGSAIGEFGDVVLDFAEPTQSRRSIINTSPERAQDPMFEDSPGCLMYKQGSFQIGNLPDDTTVGPDGDVEVFVLPAVTAGETPPLLIGGDVAAGLTDREETWELLSFLASPESGEAWAETGGFISPHAAFSPDAYADPFDRRMADLVRRADVVRFDGSDRMYAPVGTDAFLDAMTIYIASNRVELAQETAQAGYDR